MKRLFPYMALLGLMHPINTNAATIDEFPYSENFEINYGDWINHQFEGLDWLRISGPTPTANTGPSTASSGQNYLYVEASGQQSYQQEAYLEAQVNFQTLMHPAMELSYHMFGAEMGTLSIDVYNGEWYYDVLHITGQQHAEPNSDWKRIWIDLGAWAGDDNVIIRIVGQTGNGPTSDIAIDQINIRNGLPTLISNYPYSESFEDGLGNWVNIAADDFDWNLQSGSTPSNTTGPAGASHGEQYVYAEASGANNPFKAVSMQAVFDVTTLEHPEFSFMYHMFGTTIGSLVVDIYDEEWHLEEFIIIGQQLDFEDQLWTRGSIDLLDYIGADSLIIRISAVVGNGFSSDIALDHFVMQNKPIIRTLPYCTDFEQEDRFWHNRAGDGFDWTRNTGRTASSGTGPLTAEKGNHYIFTESSGGSHPNKKAELSALVDFSAIVAPELHLTYFMYGAGMGTLQVRAFTNKWVDLGQFGGSQQLTNDQEWGEMTVDLSPLSGWNNVELVIEAQTGSDYRSDIAIDQICIRSQQINASYPTCESFESTMGIWNNSINDQANWLRNSGNTPTANTGPSDALDGSYYLYLESNINEPDGKRGWLEANVDLSTAFINSIDFDYFMHGANTGDLHVWVYDETWTELWSVTGPQQQNPNADWLHTSVDLSDYDGKLIQIRIEGILGNGPYGNIAIDNVSVGGGCMYWTGKKDINWHDPENWSTERVPRPEDNVVIPDVSLASGNFPHAMTIQRSARCRNITIEHGASVTIDAKNKFELMGDLINHGENSLGNGELIIAGSVPQKTSGRIEVGSCTMRQLSIEGLTIGADLVVLQQIEFRQGVINTGHSEVRIANASPVSIRQINSSSFINGQLTRRINDKGKKYLFPIGHGPLLSDYHPFWLLNDDLAGTEFVTGMVRPHIKAGLENDKELLLDTSEMRYNEIAPEAIWFIEPDVQPNGGSYGVRLSTLNFTSLRSNRYAPVKRPSNSARTRDWKVPNGTSIPQKGKAGRSLMSGYGQRMGYTSFSQHAFAIDNHNTVLPAEWGEVFISELDNRLEIQWTTLSEINNEYFVVEQSLDGEVFTELGQVTGAGTSSEALHYSFISEIGDDITYYRIRQVDFDGAHSLSETVSYEPTSQNDLPATAQIISKNRGIQINAQEGGFVTVTNASGQVVHRTVIPEGNHKLDTANWASGFYLLALENPSQNHLSKFILR